jgi:hypothetical protein
MIHVRIPFTLQLAVSVSEFGDSFLKDRFVPFRFS